MTDPTRRLCAALVALAAWIGLAAGCAAVFGRTGSLGTTAWVMLGYFTNTTGLLVAVVFTGIAAGARAPARPWPLAAIALMTLLVGIVKRLLLQGLRTPTGGDAVADVLLHQALPVLVPLFWLAFAQKGRLRAVDPLVWTAYPLAFLAYALVRGDLTGRYAYPFIDVARFGWERVGLICAAITAGFLATGWALVALDRLIAAARARATRGRSPEPPSPRDRPDWA